MKSLLLLIAVLAAATSFSAVYELKMIVITSTPAEAKIKEAKNYCAASGDIVYRKLNKQKIVGIVWGSACEYGEGMAMWNDTTKEQYIADFQWQFLNRIGAKGSDAEGLWTLDLFHSTEIHAGNICGGASGSVSKEGYVSLSGNLAGYMYAGQVVKVQKKGSCARCGSVDVKIVTTEAWGLCDCETVDNEHTVVHGTWTLKYLSKASAKYDSSKSIKSAYSFPSYVVIE